MTTSTSEIKSTNDMKRAFFQRARDMDLTVNCGMDGAFNAEVVIIGEAPGLAEEQNKTPMSGPTGRLFWNAMKRANLSRMQCYTTNVVKRQISFGKDADRATINRHELDNWIGLLHWELSHLPNVKYIVLLGNQAMLAMHGEKGVMNWRGSVVPIRWYNVRTAQMQDATGYIMFNPVMVMREPKTEIVFRFDVAKLRKLVDGTFKEYTITPIIDPSPREAIDWCAKMIDEKRHIAYDIETISMETACVGFANNAHEGMCINFRDIASNRWTVQEEREVRRAIQRVLDHEDSKLLAQNGTFDAYWLWYKDRIRSRPHYMDTLLAHHTLYPQLPHNLGFLTSQYTNHPYYKDEKVSWKEGGDISSFWEYNVKDCCVLHAIALSLENELAAQDLREFFFSHVMRLQPHLIRMTVGGMKTDIAMKAKLSDEMGSEVSMLLQEFHQHVQARTGDPDYTPNPRSPKQMSELYFNILRLVGRGTSTAEENRARMRDHPRTDPADRAIIDLHNKYAKENKFLTTYVDSRIDPDSRIRCEYKQFGTQSAPGRLSSAAVMWESGMNLQNQTERSMQMFVADDGYVFCYFDLAQAEARVVAYEANIPTWKEQFERARLDGSYDCHRALASDMWNMEYDLVPAVDFDKETGEKTVRYIAKRCRHGLNYRMQAPRLATTAGLTMSEANHAYMRYHQNTPELRTWWEALEGEVRSTKMLFNCFGRRLMILERLDDKALESIVAFKPQSAIGDKVSMVMYQCEDDDKWPHDARMLLNVHDALIALAPASKAMSVLQIMKRHAEAPLTIKGEQLIIPADCKISYPDEHGVHRWGNLKPVEIEI